MGLVGGHRPSFMVSMERAAFIGILHNCMDMLTMSSQLCPLTKSLRISALTSARLHLIASTSRLLTCQHTVVGFRSNQQSDGSARASIMARRLADIQASD